MEEKILLKAQTIRISAILNGTVAARDFAERLPLTVSGTRSLDAYCFPAAIGCFDPEETQIGWKNGDISLSGGWLRIFFDDEETSGHSAGVMVIGRISYHLDKRAPPSRDRRCGADHRRGERKAIRR